MPLCVLIIQIFNLFLVFSFYVSCNYILIGNSYQFIAKMDGRGNARRHDLVCHYNRTCHLPRNAPPTVVKKHYTTYLVDFLVDFFLVPVVLYCHESGRWSVCAWWMSFFGGYGLLGHGHAQLTKLKFPCLEFGMKMSLLEHVGIGCVGSGGGA
jgi:hypothetical protein